MASSLLVKFSTLAGGVFIEQSGNAEYAAWDRCFRFDGAGNAEYAHFSDIAENGALARFYGHVMKESDFVFA